VQAQIQGEQVRITGKQRDDLQEVIALLPAATINYPSSSSTSAIEDLHEVFPWFTSLAGLLVALVAGQALAQEAAPADVLKRVEASIATLDPT